MLKARSVRDTLTSGATGSCCCRGDFQTTNEHRRAYRRVLQRQRAGRCCPRGHLTVLGPPPLRHSPLSSPCPLPRTETPRAPSLRGLRGLKRDADQRRIAAVRLGAIPPDAKVFNDGPRPMKKDARAEDVDDHDRAVHVPRRCVDNTRQVFGGRLEKGLLHDEDWREERGSGSVKGQSGIV